MNFFKQHSVFLFILLISAFLRFLPLFEYQFTFDELSGLDRTQFSSFKELIEKGVKIDAHPALVQVLIYYLTKFFGYVTWVIKLPFLLFSLGATSYAYAFGVRNFSKQAGLLAACIFSFSLIFVFYAPIARMYISGVFFSMALLYYFFEIFFQENFAKRSFVFLGLFALLSALNHHINALFAFTICVSGLFFLTNLNFKPFLIACGLVVLTYLPHLSLTLYQLSVPGIGRENGGWLEVSEFSIVFDFVKILFGTGKAYFVLLGIMIVSVFLNKKITVSKKHMYLILIFCLNYTIIYLYSVLRSPIYQNSIMLFSATALIVGLCGFVEFRNQLIFYTMLFVLSAFLIYKSYIKKDYFHQAVKTVYEFQFERTLYHKSIYGDKNVYPIFCDADTLMEKIYFGKYGQKFDCKISADSLISNMENKQFEQTGKGGLEKVSTLKLFSEFIKKLKTDYLVISSSMPLQQAIIKEYFPYLIENIQTQAINYKMYSKKGSDKSKVVTDDQILLYSDVNAPANFNYSKTQHVDGSREAFFIKVDSLNEFPFDAKADLNSIVTKEGEVVLVSAVISVNSLQNESELCISLQDKENDESIAYSAKVTTDFVLKADSTVNIYSEYFNGTKFNSTKDKAILTTYIWNKAKQPSVLKEFTIRVIDYWPMKWHFWD